MTRPNDDSKPKETNSSKDADAFVTYDTATLVARIGAKPAAPDRATADAARIRAEPLSERSTRKACKIARIGEAMSCEGLGSFPDVTTAKRKNICRILTNIPGQLPIVTGEVALIETYYPTLLAIMLANDNTPDTGGGPQT